MATNRIQLLAPLIALVGIASGCQKEFSPVWPDAPIDGVYIYSEPNYSGRSAQLLKSAYNLSDYTGPCGIEYLGTSKSWAGCISSIRVTSGWQTTLYSGANYGGKSLPLTEDVPDLRMVAGPRNGSWNKCPASLFVARQ
jgi:hypothetical protein